MFQRLISLAQSIWSWIWWATSWQIHTTPNPDVIRVTYQVIPYQFGRINAESMEAFVWSCQHHHIIHTRAIHHQGHHTQLYLRIPQKYQNIIQDLMYQHRWQTECILTQITVPPTQSWIHCVGYEHTPSGKHQGVWLTHLINSIATHTEWSWTYLDINPKKHHIVAHKQAPQSRRSKFVDVTPSQTPVSDHIYDLKIRYGCNWSTQHQDVVVSTLQSYTSHPVTIHSTSKRSGISCDLAARMIQIPDAQACQTLSYVSYRKLVYPANLPRLADQEDKNQITLLGSTEYRNQHQHFGVLVEDKLKHMYIVGKTGTGKSTLISQMVKSDMVTNKGLCLIDPHGDLIQTVLNHVPSYRINDVILFDVADQDYPVWFNVLHSHTEQEQNLTVSWLVTTFKKLYGNSRWPRLEYILRISLLTIIKYPQASLVDLTRILTDKVWRTHLLSYVTDPMVLNFWHEEFDKRPDRLRDESISPILNKVWQFLSSPIIRNIFAQEKNMLDLRKIMDEGKILLVNLSKWQIWEDNCDMIGSFLVSKFQIDALSRADADYDQRRDFYLYIDEFQNFATESFATIFSEARKYKLSLIVANQYIWQLAEPLRNAIFGNVGSIISFTLWYDDAIAIKSQFKDLVSEHDLQNLPKFHAYIRLMIQGTMSNPFSMSTFPLHSPGDVDQHLIKIRDQSRQRYATHRSVIQTQIHKHYHNKHTTYKQTWQKKGSTPVLHTKYSKQPVRNVQLADQKWSNNLVSDIKTPQPTNSLYQTIKTTQDLAKDHTYSGIIKLKYNYGLFVVVWAVEWLLHKSKISDPLRKKNYQIGDMIDVRLDSISEKDWIDKAVWIN